MFTLFSQPRVTPDLLQLQRRRIWSKAAAGTVRLAIHLQSNTRCAAFCRRSGTAIGHVLSLFSTKYNPEIDGDRARLPQR